MTAPASPAEAPSFDQQVSQLLNEADALMAEAHDLHLESQRARRFGYAALAGAAVRIEQGTQLAATRLGQTVESPRLRLPTEHGAQVPTEVDARPTRKQTPQGAVVYVHSDDTGSEDRARELTAADKRARKFSFRTFQNSMEASGPGGHAVFKGQRVGSRMYPGRRRHDRYIDSLVASGVLTPAQGNSAKYPDFGVTRIPQLGTDWKPNPLASHEHRPHAMETAGGFVAGSRAAQYFDLAWKVDPTGEHHVEFFRELGLSPRDIEILAPQGMDPNMTVEDLRAHVVHMAAEEGARRNLRPRTHAQTHEERMIEIDHEEALDEDRVRTIDRELIGLEYQINDLQRWVDWKDSAGNRHPRPHAVEKQTQLRRRQQELTQERLERLENITIHTADLRRQQEGADLYREGGRYQRMAAQIKEIAQPSRDVLRVLYLDDAVRIAKELGIPSFENRLRNLMWQPSMFGDALIPAQDIKGAMVTILQEEMGQMATRGSDRPNVGKTSKSYNSAQRHAHWRELESAAHIAHMARGGRFNLIGDEAAEAIAHAIPLRQAAERRRLEAVKRREEAWLLRYQVERQKKIDAAARARRAAPAGP